LAVSPRAPADVAGFQGRLRACRKPPVDLQMTGVTCRTGRRFHRRFAPAPPGRTEVVLGFTCQVAKSRTSPGLRLTCVRGHRAVRFRFF
ncbi:MAG TPA: hypothetical protein VF752_11355, partial [Thermoleophilaceae bacterium]